MVQGKKAFNNSKPMFAEVVIGDREAKEMRVAAKGRPSRSPYLKLVYPNGVTLAENGGYPPAQNGDIRSLFWLFSLMALQN